MKKAKQLLAELPEPYSTQALGYFNKRFYEERLAEEPSRVSDALTMSFDWEQTKEGYAYWYELFKGL